MKHAKPGLTLFAILILAMCAACRKSTETSSTSNTAPSSTLQNAPTPLLPRSGSLVDAISTGEVTCQWSGAGNAAKMHVTVRSKTERVWELKIEVGTKLEPGSGEGNVQQMTVTREYEIHLEPHDEEKLDIEVACLDINKDAPDTDDTTWRVKASRQLAQFITCANRAIDELVHRGQEQPSARHDLLQAAVWKARGATREDFINLGVKDGGVSEEEATQQFEQDDPFVAQVIQRCESLATLN